MEINYNNPLLSYNIIKENNIIKFINKKMANQNQGDNDMPSIRYREKQKIYEARYTQNKTQKSVYAKTKKECIAKLKNALKNKEKTKAISYTLYTWLHEWFNTYKKPNLKPTSLYQIKICINKHIKNNIKDININNLTAIEINKALNKIESSRMKKYTYDVYCETLKTAYKNKIIKEDITLNIQTVKHERKKGNALTIHQQEKFISSIDNPKHKNIFLFYLSSGLRKSELLNLKWTDIDYEKNIVIIKGTKSKNANRIIPLFNVLKQKKAGLLKRPAFFC